MIVDVSPLLEIVEEEVKIMVNFFRELSIVSHQSGLRGEGTLRGLGVVRENLLGLRADSAFGFVDSAQKGEVVLVGSYESEVGESVSYFFSFIESRRVIDFVWESIFEEGVFQHSHLSARSDQDGDVIVADGVL